MQRHLIVLGALLLLSFGCVEEFVEPGAVAVWQQKDEGTWNIRYSVWNENAHIWYTPGGSTSALIADLEGDDHDPYVDSDGFGTAIAVWSNEHPSFSHIYYSMWKSDTGTWSAPSAIATPAGYSMDPAVAMEDAAHALAVWVQKGTDGKTSLFYSTFAGGRWSAPAQVHENTGVSLPELKFSPATGAYFLTWSENNGSATRAYSAVYRNGWSAPVEIPGQTVNAVMDNNMPTDERMGLAASADRKEAYAVWATTGGAVYYSKWSSAGWSNAAKLSDGKMPDADYESGGTPYTLFIQSGTLWSNLKALGAVPGTSADFRPAIAFLTDGKVALGLFWTTVAAPSEIYYARWDGMLWEPVKAVDVVPGEDRNPDVSPLFRAYETVQDINFCLDGVVQRPNMFGQMEECEDGVVPCPNPNEICWFCKCYPYIYPNNTWCGDGVVQRPNSAGMMEQCEKDADCAAGQKCVNCICVAGQEPPPGDGEPPVTPPGEETPPEGEEPEEAAPVCGNGRVEGGEQCDKGAQNISGTQYPAGMDTCPAGETCKSDCTCGPGVITPRCGDGYISSPGHGGSEECDLGGRYNAPPLPDTCPPPTYCSPTLCRCITPPQEDDGLHYACVEGTCVALEGEGPNECLRDDQCWHNVCEDGTCIEVMGPGEDQCEDRDDCWHNECEDGECIEVMGPGDDGCLRDSQCRHMECVDEECIEVLEPGTDECQEDGDCVTAYCGNGRVDPGEECDGDVGCESGGVCEDCRCYYPPELDCMEICGATPGADFIAQGLLSSSECGSEAEWYYESYECDTTCIYSWFYKVTSVAGMDSCCCGMVKRFDCTNCPCEPPCDQGCPDPDEICDAEAPSWYYPD